MELEPRLAIILYPNCVTTKTGYPFLKDCSMLSNTTWYQIYVDKFYIGEEKLTTVKLFVGHNTPPAAFNSLEFTQKEEELDGEVWVCIIQASKVVDGRGLIYPWFEQANG